jgi:hypothetical protein
VKNPLAIHQIYGILFQSYGESSELNYESSELNPESDSEQNAESTPHKKAPPKGEAFISLH